MTAQPYGDPAAYKSIRVTLDGPIAVVYLSRPPRNAWSARFARIFRSHAEPPDAGRNMAMKDELIDIYPKLDNDDRVKVVILTGDGKFFCAGERLPLACIRGS